MAFCLQGGTGKMMSIGLHQRLMGHPARARAVGMLLDYCATCPDVWVTSRKALAVRSQAICRCLWFMGAF